MIASCYEDDTVFIDDGSRRCDNVVTGSDFVTCGGQTYRTIQIGSQIWMAENLNYNTAGSGCYSNNSGNCATYGRLYNWHTASAVCPDGWHLPSDEEWTILTNFIGSNAGTKLKVENGWNGTDDYGFSALPGGRCIGKLCRYINADGFWWTASESSDISSWFRYIYNNGSNVGKSTANRPVWYSVRCIQTTVPD